MTESTPTYTLDMGVTCPACGVAITTGNAGGYGAFCEGCVESGAYEMQKLKAPMPYFGGKSKVAAEVWKRFGKVSNYVEPFFGSGAVLLKRPLPANASLPKETINDKDGFVSNFWRAVKAEPLAVAKWADWPANENDLHARHGWLVNQESELTARLEGDPEYYDAKVAGWWVWGIALWIGSGWCSGNGPWHQVDGQLIHLGDNGRGINRQLIHLGDNGQGINRQRLHLGNNGQGINRQRLHLGNGGTGQGVTAVTDLEAYMMALQARLRRVRVCSGDWSRVCGKSVTYKHGLTAVFLDPPYNSDADRQSDLYRVDDESIATAVREWAIENGRNPLMRIALCGYENEHGQHMPDDWDIYEWNAGSGYAAQGDNVKENGKRERIWFSPHCIKPNAVKQTTLWDAMK